MQKGDLIFVYGTLRLGESSSLGESSRFTGLANHKGESRINGSIYDLGWYPGVKAPDNKAFHPDEDTVTGDVFSIDDDFLPRMLDAYEGYPHLYNRKKVMTENGDLAWVYTYNSRCREESRIDSGNWKDRKEP